MDLDQIKSLMEAMAASHLDELEFREGDWSLRLVRRAARAEAPPIRASINSTRATADRSRPFVSNRPAPAAPSVAVAPLHGVVYLRSGPDTADFVTVGQAVPRGAPLCVIEAMKVFHEIVADRDATIAAVLVTSGQEVEAGQHLFRFG